MWTMTLRWFTVIHGQSNRDKNNWLKSREVHFKQGDFGLLFIYWGRQRPLLLDL